MLHRERRVGNPPKRRNRIARESAKQTSPKNMDHTPLPPSIGYPVGLYGKTRTPCRAANSIHSDDNESNKKLKSLLLSTFQLLLLRNP